MVKKNKVGVKSQMFDRRTFFSNKPAAWSKAQVQGEMMTAAFDGLFASLTGQDGLFVSDFLIVKKYLFYQIKVCLYM